MLFSINIIIPVALFAFAAFFIIIGVYAAVYASNNKKQASIVESPEWAYTGIAGVLYRVFFRGADPEVTAEKFGVDVKEHNRFCMIAKKEPDFERLCIFRLLGIIILVVCFLLMLPTRQMAFAIIGIVAFILLFMYDRMTVRSQAQKKETQIQDEVPRFLDLLQPQLETGIPIETAIKLICDRSDMLIAEEFKEALAKTEIGEIGWDGAIEEVAEKYDVETLTSFVVSATSAYRKGVSIEETVRRESKEIKQTYLLHKKENAKKAQNTILIPIVGFQMVPLIAFMLVPSFIQMQGGF